jgi:hypothetical protein
VRSITEVKDRNQTPPRLDAEHFGVPHLSPNHPPNAQRANWTFGGLH